MNSSVSDLPLYWQLEMCSISVSPGHAQNLFPIDFRKVRPCSQAGWALPLPISPHTLYCHPSAISPGLPDINTLCSCHPPASSSLCSHQEITARSKAGVYALQWATWKTNHHWSWGDTTRDKMPALSWRPWCAKAQNKHCKANDFNGLIISGQAKFERQFKLMLVLCVGEGGDSGLHCTYWDPIWAFQLPDLYQAHLQSLSAESVHFRWLEP